MSPADGWPYMAEAKTTPISFRVSNEALEQLRAVGKSPVEIARAAIEREARLARKRQLIERIKANPYRSGLGDATEFIRRERDSA